jgi:shikimate dehydrogenase
VGGTVAIVTVPATPGRRCAVLGSPVSHSLSPVLHRAAYEHLGLSGWTYEAYDVDEPGLAAFVNGLDGSWAGLSLTMPLKRAAIPLCDAVSQLARDVEAVNTVVFRPDGTRFGENTDVPGMVAALREAGVASAPAAAVLGGGATATSAVAALRDVCSGNVEVYVRSERRAAEMTASAARLGTPVAIRPWEDAVKALSQPLVVSTTSAGGSDHLAELVPDRPGVLFDVLYHPWPTPLAAAWAARGGPVVSGLDQLVHQAVPQVELMTGHRVDRERLVRLMRAAGQRALATRTG